jgi:cytoskeletal protein RodZ
MASRGHLPRNPHLQVGSRLTALFLVASLAFTFSPAEAATKSPTPKASAKATAKPKATVKAPAKPAAKPSAKSTAKTTAKPAIKATSKTTAKPSAKPTSKATAKATTKATTKPKATKKPAVKKKKKKAKVSVTPSPKPAWPPKGFSVEGEVYAKVPSAKELVSLISANTYLERQIKDCTKYICGAVQVVAENGCIWWQVVAQVTDGQGRKLGELTKAFAGSTAKEFKTLLMISPETLENGGEAKITSVICNHADRDPAVSGSTYTKA